MEAQRYLSTIYSKHQKSNLIHKSVLVAIIPTSPHSRVEKKKKATEKTVPQHSTAPYKHTQFPTIHPPIGTHTSITLRTTSYTPPLNKTEPVPPVRHLQYHHTVLSVWNRPSPSRPNPITSRPQQQQGFQRETLWIDLFKNDIPLVLWTPSFDKVSGSWER